MKDTVICFGAAHWDIIARAAPGASGIDRPGTVETRPGGVALNIAAALARNGVSTQLIASVGDDDQGVRLLTAIQNLDVGTAHLFIANRATTGQYVAVEDADGELLHAVADTSALNTLTADRVSIADLAKARCWVIETNLRKDFLAAVASFNGRPKLVANPVSEAKASQLASALPHLSTLYCNRREAEVLCRCSFKTSNDAAEALRSEGVNRAVVTDGAGVVTDCSGGGTFRAQPPTLEIETVTGAGDAFMAGHLAASLSDHAPADSLNAGFRAVQERNL